MKLHDLTYFYQPKKKKLNEFQKFYIKWIVLVKGDKKVIRKN